MRLHLMSDIHLNHYSDKGAKFLKDLEPEGADVAVVAGDIADPRVPEQYRNLFERLAELYKHTIVVLGNHDYYKSDWSTTHHVVTAAISGLPNTHLLDRSETIIDGQRFLGHAMWFRDTPEAQRGKNYFSDFLYIKGLENWVFEENAEFEGWIIPTLNVNDIVVTHHMPSQKSVAPQWKRSPSNCYFVCEMDGLIARAQPKLWLHGHTHDPFDYVIGNTRVVCEPRGYPRERTGPYKPKLIEVP